MNKVIVLLAAFMFVSCGIYSFRGSLPDHLEDIQIRSFDNRTTEFAVDVDIEEALVQRMQSERLPKAPVPYNMNLFQ